MDRWGISGCLERKDEIIRHLVNNRDILVRAITASSAAQSVIGWVASSRLGDSFLSKGALWLLDAAIEDVRRELRERPTPGRTDSKRRAVRRHHPAFVSAFRSMGDPARFISSAQFQSDIKLLLEKFPSDFTAIAGVARSGLSVATMLSMYTHLPMLTIRQTANDVVDTGNGWRLGGNRHVDPSKARVLVVDDTVMTGNSLKAIRPLVQSQFQNAVFAAVYVNPLANEKPDFWAVDLPWPHLLEWNLFNSVLSPSVAMDFDGILCHDCRPEQDDDGTEYLNFLRNSGPRYLPRKVPVPLIVTARLEKYRSETEDWLRRHGVKWHRLVMHPAGTLAERQRDDIAAFKARHYTEWASRHRAAPGPILFVESDDHQASRIAQLSRKMVVCPGTARVY